MLLYGNREEEKYQTSNDQKRNANNLNSRMKRDCELWVCWKRTIFSLCNLFGVLYTRASVSVHACKKKYVMIASDGMSDEI